MVEVLVHLKNAKVALSVGDLGACLSAMVVAEGLIETQTAANKMEREPCTSCGGFIGHLGRCPVAFPLNTLKELL